MDYLVAGLGKGGRTAHQAIAHVPHDQAVSRPPALHAAAGDAGRQVEAVSAAGRRPAVEAVPCAAPIGDDERVWVPVYGTLPCHDRAAALRDCRSL
ncbi:MAG TPA: hypothetical protein VHG52_01265 [Thermomicrobiales bacterium]|nr:hypothetical protein [Thermomicrobiales bacterium]